MQAKELVLDNCSKGQEVKEFSQAPPDVGITVLPAALIIKSIDLSNLSRFMVSSQNSYPILVSNFQG
jgi:hypothetical protein